MLPLPVCYFSDEKCTRPYALEGDLPNKGPVYCQNVPGAYRLPTEEEQEYAARGAKCQKETEYAGSDRQKDVAWFDANDSKETQEVGLLQPNALGLYDMSGNVREQRGEQLVNQPYYKENFASDGQTNLGVPLGGSFPLILVKIESDRKEVSEEGEPMAEQAETNASSQRRRMPNFDMIYTPQLRSYGIGFRLAKSQRP